MTFPTSLGPSGVVLEPRPGLHFGCPELQFPGRALLDFPPEDRTTLSTLPACQNSSHIDEMCRSTFHQLSAVGRYVELLV